MRSLIRVGQVKVVLVAALLAAGALGTGCIPMRTIHGSSMAFLTNAGATVSVPRQPQGTATLVEQLFAERGYQVFSRAQVAPGNVVVFLNGSPDRWNRGGRGPEVRPDGYPSYPGAANPSYPGGANPANPAANPSYPGGAANPAANPAYPGGANPAYPGNGGRPAGQQQLGSWFAVRVKDDGANSIIQFYGKPTVYGSEGCSDGDSDLRDAKYTCTDLKVREDWPGVALTAGREETRVIAGIIATLVDRVTPR
jgi:hypothetical protein